MLNVCYESCKKCNLCCDYCISSDNCVDEAAGYCDYKEIVHRIALLKPDRIVLSGGEPLKDDQLLDKLKELRSQCPNAYISLSTNGSISFVFETLKGLVDCIDISLPSTDSKIYELMRGKDLSTTVIENIKKIKALGFNTRISFVLTKINSSSLIGVLDLAEKIGVDSVRIGRFLPLRNAKNVQEKYVLSKEKIQQIIGSINLEKYSFTIIPPISELKNLEDNYLVIDFNGRWFLPKAEGKVYLRDDEVEQKINNQYAVFKSVELKDKYEQFFRPFRIRKNEPQPTPVDEFYSDRTRILFSPSFRRMQQKAQVFSLEKNPSIHSRLTHSIEVSDIGRRLALRIAEKLCNDCEKKEYKLLSEHAESLVAIVENACLIHDMGNPPFGHFGEAAIKRWWKDNCKLYLKEYNERATRNSEISISYTDTFGKRLLADFSEFDGNPQGIRTILRLCGNKDEEGSSCQSGLNLSYPTILCAIKYARVAGADASKRKIHKDLVGKAGFFRSERNLVEKIYDEVGMSQRHPRYPFTYIMEAADDIAYGISDISDGIDKKILTLDTFVEEFRRIWKDEYKEDVTERIIPSEITDLLKNKQKHRKDDFNVLLGSHWKTLLIDAVVKEYTANIDKYMTGTVAPILKNIAADNEANKVLHVLKTISKRIIYRTPEAEEIEMAGYSIISGLLNYFGKLLTLTFDEFDELIKEDGKPSEKKLDLEWRIFNRLSKTCVSSYIEQLKELSEYYSGKADRRHIEWWLRVHMIIDYVAGMTDDYALETYQVTSGIKISIF